MLPSLTPLTAAAAPALSALPAVPSLVPAQGILGSEAALYRLLIATAVLLVVVLVGRFVLAVAWKLLLVAGVVIGALYLASVVTI